MHRPPGHPGNPPGQLQTPDHADGRRSSDRGEFTLVAIAECGAGTTGEVGLDHRRNVRSTLNGTLGDARHRGALRRRVCDVTDREQVRRSGNRQVVGHLDASSPVGRCAEQRCQRGGGVAGTPDDGAGRDRSVAGLYLELVEAGDLHPEAHVDTESTELGDRFGRQRLGIGRQHPVETFEQDHLRGAGVDPAELVAQCAEGDLGDGARHLDTGGSAADHDEGEVRLALVVIVGAFGALECGQHAPSDLQGILDGLEARCESFPLGIAEIRVRRPGCEHEVVEGHLASVVEPHDLRLAVDVDDLAEYDVDVQLLGHDRADRLGDVGRSEAGSGDLVEQRLEEMVVAAVDQRQPNVGVCQPSRRSDPTEAATDDHHVRSSATRHVSRHDGPPGGPTRRRSATPRSRGHPSVGRRSRTRSCRRDRVRDARPARSRS